MNLTMSLFLSVAFYLNGWLEEKAGAVHLVLPRDIAKQNSDIEPIKRTQGLSRPKPAHKLVEMADKDDCGSRTTFVAIREWCYKR